MGNRALSSGKRGIILWETWHYPLENGTLFSGKQDIILWEKMALSSGKQDIISGKKMALSSGKQDIILWGKKWHYPLGNGTLSPGIRLFTTRSKFVCITNHCHLPQI